MLEGHAMKFRQSVWATPFGVLRQAAAFQHIVRCSEIVQRQKLSQRLKACGF